MEELVMNQITNEERLSILSLPVLRRNEIMLLEDCSYAQAGKIMNKCKTLFNGEVKYRSFVITTDSYCAYNGSTQAIDMKKYSHSNEEVNQHA